MLIYFFYSSYIFIELIKNLYIVDHNWIIKPSHESKLSSIIFIVLMVICSFTGFLYFLLTGIAYLDYGYIVPTKYPPYDEYPSIYFAAVYIIIMVAFTGGLTPLVGYLHISLRLKSIWDQNIYFKQVIPSCYFKVIWIAQCLQGLGIASLILMNGLGDEFKKSNYNYPLVVGIIVFCLFLTINISLLYYYIRGLYGTASNQARIAKHNLNAASDDDKVHEHIKEATRYVVLFGSVIICDVLTLIIGAVVIATEHHEYRCDSFAMIIGELALAVEVYIFLQSVYLSWVFNHEAYEKWYRCGKCDACVITCCNRFINRKYIKMMKDKANNGYTAL